MNYSEKPMIRILLLDCSDALEEKLKAQGFDVKSGTVGLWTGVRKLPCQVYENDVFIYNPGSAPQSLPIRLDRGNIFTEHEVKDGSPQYSLKYLQSHIENSGATFLVFVNRLSDVIQAQEVVYKWIPFMPSIEFTSDQAVGVNAFSEYPDWQWKLLAPIVTREELSLPVLQKVVPPVPQDYPRDVFRLFWNGNGDYLGVLILRGRGRLIVLPKFASNDTVVETFLHRVLPHIYETKTKTGLAEMFTSPEERTSEEELKELQVIREEIKNRENAARVRLATATRKKSKVIDADATAKQILIYYSQARRQPDAALFYLYKIIESIENKFGGEAAGIAAVGAGAQWKSVKRLANESYRDARHAPKPTDVIKQWSEREIEKCFEDTEKVAMGYFATLFSACPAEDAAKPK